MNWLQIRLFGPYFSSFSTSSYGYYSQMSQNLVSNIQIFASVLIVRQAARKPWREANQQIKLNSHQKLMPFLYGRLMFARQMFQYHPMA